LYIIFKNGFETNIDKEKNNILHFFSNTFAKKNI